jgi:hypothetical protein
VSIDLGWRHLDVVTPAVLEPVLEAWRTSHPRCAVLALLPEAAAADVATLQEACRAAGVPLVGGLFPRLIHQGGFVNRGAWLLRFDEAPPHGLVDGLDDGAAVASGRLAAVIEPSLGKHERPGTLFLLCDATTPDLGGVLDGLAGQLGPAVRHLGVLAGSESFRPMPCLFDERRLVGAAALWLLLPARQRALLVHDYAAPEGVGVATSASGNRVITVDDRPAFEFYRDTLLEQHGVALTRENFYRHAVEFPLAIELQSGELLVRMPVALEDDGSIRCGGPIPERAVLVVCQAPQPRFGEAGRALAARLGEAGVASPMLLFYCAGRRLRLGSESETDLRAILGITGATAAGAITLGEIGSADSGSYPLLHNGALVCTGWEPR